MHNGRGGESGWNGTRNRAWDAPTPRASRGGSPDDDRPVHLNEREWEEEQLRMDRDWYSTAEEGGLVGDDAHNPFFQYRDKESTKQLEIATKQVKKVSARQAQYV